MNKFKKEIKFVPNRGTMDIKFFLKGEAGIIQFCIATGWTTDMQDFDTKIRTYAYDVGMHSPKKMYDDQKPMASCEFYETCYYDGSSMCAKDLFKKFIEAGEDYVWYEMEK